VTIYLGARRKGTADGVRAGPGGVTASLGNLDKGGLNVRLAQPADSRRLTIQPCAVGKR
jgi:hypothetical protein